MRDLVQKAFYLGLGIASYAAEKATSNLQELRIQAQKLADEMVERGEMTADEARRYVDDLINQAQVMPENKEDNSPREPRRIEIVFDDGEENPKTNTSDSSTASNNPNNVEELRKQVETLQEELRKMRRQ